MGARVNGTEIWLDLEKNGPRHGFVVRPQRRSGHIGQRVCGRLPLGSWSAGKSFPSSNRSVAAGCAVWSLRVSVAVTLVIPCRNFRRLLCVGALPEHGGYVAAAANAG